MGFADNLRSNTPSSDQVYQNKLEEVLRVIMSQCQIKSEQGSRSYCSAGDRYGIPVKFPRQLSKRQIKDIGKKLTKDIEQKMIKEGFKPPYVEIRKTTCYVDYWEIEVDVSCGW